MITDTVPGHGDDPPTDRAEAVVRTASRELDIVYDSRQSPPMVALFDLEADACWVRGAQSILMDLNTMD